MQSDQDASEIKSSEEKHASKDSSRKKKEKAPIPSIEHYTIDRTDRDVSGLAANKGVVLSALTISISSDDIETLYRQVLPHKQRNNSG